MISNIMVPKNQLITIPENLNCQDALEILESNQLRNAPVVDETGSMFRGNIYRYHIYKHVFHNRDCDLSQISVTHFLKNTTRVVHINESIYQLLFAIRDLPYITVLSEQNSFMGVVYHDDLLNYLAQAWSANNTGYLLKIKLEHEKGELNKLTRIISKYATLEATLTFNKTTMGTDSFVIVALADDLDIVQVNALVHNLKRKKYDVINYSLK